MKVSNLPCTFSEMIISCYHFSTYVAHVCTTRTAGHVVAAFLLEKPEMAFHTFTYYGIRQRILNKLLESFAFGHFKFITCHRYVVNLLTSPENKQDGNNPKLNLKL